MNYLDAAFFLTKLAYAESDVNPVGPHVPGSDMSHSNPTPAPYTAPPVPGGHDHPLYKRLALAKDTLDHEWRNWVAARGEGNPYGFMGYIAQCSPEARARAARHAIVMPAQPANKVGSFIPQSTRRQQEDGKFRKAKAGDERPSSEEISLTAKEKAAEFYGLKMGGFFDEVSHVLRGSSHTPSPMPLMNVRPHAPLLSHKGPDINSASTKILNASGRPSPAHLAIHEDVHPWAKVVHDASKQSGSIVDNSYNKLRSMNVPIEYPNSMNHLFEQLENLGVPGHHLTAPIDHTQYKLGGLDKLALGLKDMLRMQHYADLPVARLPHGVPAAISSIPRVAQGWLAKAEFSAPKAIAPQAIKSPVRPAAQYSLR